MQYLNTRKAIGLILALAFFIGGTHTALAIGTASDTTISNTATVDYDVGGDARSSSGSAPDFKVDNKVDLTVTNTDAGNNVNTIPAATGQVLTFTVTNTGNTSQGYALTATNAAGDDFDMTGVSIYIENGVTPGFQSTEDTVYTSGSGNNAFDLAADATSVNVYVVANTPATATDTQVAGIDLLATTLDVSTNLATSADASPDADPLVVDTIFADGSGSIDGARDGEYSTAATYTVASAALTVAKSVASTTDPFLSGFSVPGAYVVYQVRVTNSGASTADTDSVSVTDQVPANTQLCITTVGTCTAPSFADGATTSALSLGAFQYSNDATATPCEPGDFTYTPSPGALTGLDPAVTCVRMTTTGDMAGSGGFFDMQITVQIQ